MTENPVRRSSSVFLALLLLACVGLGCAGRKPPGVQLERLKVEGIHITGASLEVGFRIRNTEPDLLDIERFEYQLRLNGQKVGTGYHPQALQIKGFEEATVTSRFDLSFLSLPGAIKAILDSKEVDADVDGIFYVRRSLASGKLRFKNTARIPLKK